MSRVLRYLVFAVLAGLALSVAPGIAQQGVKDGEWRAYAGDAGSTRYAPYELITRDNAKDLQVAWSWKFDNFGGGNSETTPIMANGVLYFMSRAPLGIVKEMFFTADPVSADRALRAGFVNEVIPEAELEERTYAMARTIASRSAAAVAAAKQAIHELSDAVTISPSTYERLHGLRREAYFGPEYREGIQAFLQKRPPDFEAARARAGGERGETRDDPPASG